MEHLQLGRRVREAREYLGLSQESVAEYLGIPRASVSAIETGRRKVSSGELQQLAHLLKRPITALLGEDDMVETEEPADPTFRALFRTARALSPEDRQHVLRFAQFLRHAGRAPQPDDQAEL